MNLCLKMFKILKKSLRIKTIKVYNLNYWINIFNCSSSMRYPIFNTFYQALQMYFE